MREKFRWCYKIKIKIILSKSDFYFSQMRKKYKDAFVDKHGVKLGFMSAFVQAATKALQEFPAVNAYMDIDAKQMIYHDFVDVSVAVASPNGLVCYRHFFDLHHMRRTPTPRRLTVLKDPLPKRSAGLKDHPLDDHDF